MMGVRLDQYCSIFTSIYIQLNEWVSRLMTRQHWNIWDNQ